MGRLGGELPFPIFSARVARALKADLCLSAVGGRSTRSEIHAALYFRTRRSRELYTDCAMVGRSDKERSLSFGLGDGSLPFSPLLLCQGCERESIAQADETGCFGFRLATRTEIPRCSSRRDLPGLIAPQIDISRPIDDRTDQAVEPAEHEMPLPVPTEARMDKCCPVELLAAVLAVRYASQPYGYAPQCRINATPREHRHVSGR